MNNCFTLKNMNVDKRMSIMSRYNSFYINELGTHNLANLYSAKPILCC